MSTAARFWQDIRDDVTRAIKGITPFRATADADAAGKVSIIRLGNTIADGESYGRLDGFDIADGDELVCFTIGGKPVVARLLTAAPSGHKLTGALDVMGAITGASFNSPVVAHVSQSGADVSSTTSTVNFSVAGTVTLNLPAGTWKVWAIGGAEFQHSAGGNVTWTVAIDGDDGGSRTTSMSASVWQTGVDSHELTGRTGSIPVAIKYRCGAAGTTSARNPWLFVVAVRTA